MPHNGEMKYLYLGLFSAAFSAGIALNFPKQTPSVANFSSEVAPNFLGHCNCQIGQSSENRVELEVETKCPKDRLYFQSLLSKIDPAFSSAREKKTVEEFPISCAGYIMRKFMDASARASRFYSYCARASGTPSRNRKTHCVTNEYAYSVYNSYVDIMDCLDIPQRDLLPKLYNESGLHINTLGSGMDAGIGQLTSPAIASVQQAANFDGRTVTWLSMFKEQISKSAKPTCQRIAKIPGLFDKVSTDASQRCALIGAPENPLKNILYTGIFYHYVLRSQTGSRYFKGYTYLPKGDDFIRFDHTNPDVDLKGYFEEYKVKQRMIELGIVRPNMQAMRQIMITLGYNSGMASAFILLDRFLQARKSRKVKLKESDFDFQTHFVSKLFRKSTDPAIEKQRLVDLNLARTAPYKLPFPIFLKLAQKTGTPGYVSAVANKLLILDKEMGEGLCTTPGFLKF